MRQYLKYEFKNNWKNFLLSYILIIAAFIILSIFILSIKHITQVNRVVTIIYSSIGVMLNGAMLASIVLFIINFVKSIYNSIFTDEGYLTLSFPKSLDSLIISKFIANIIWLMLYFVSVIIGVVLLYLSIFEIFGLPANELLESIIAIFDFFEAPVLLYICLLINFIVGCVLNFILLFLSFTIINTGIAKSGKIVLGILLFVGLSYALSLCKSILSFASFGFILNDYNQLEFAFGEGTVNIFTDLFFNGYVMNFTILIFEIGLIVGGYILIKYLMKNHLELE